jgi:hypothetical protein
MRFIGRTAEKNQVSCRNFDNGRILVLRQAEISGILMQVKHSINRNIGFSQITASIGF